MCHLRGDLLCHHGLLVRKSGWVLVLQELRRELLLVLDETKELVGVDLGGGVGHSAEKSCECGSSSAHHELLEEVKGVRVE